MSTAGSVNITPPTEAFLAVARKYASNIREVAEKQTNSVAKLELPHVRSEVEKVFLENHHEAVVGKERARETVMYLFNGGSCTPIHGGFVVPAIPLLINGSITAKVRFPEEQAVPVQLQEGSVVFVAGAEGVFLDALGDGKVVWVFLSYKVTFPSLGRHVQVRELGRVFDSP
ncbi:MAG: hypothetical protein M1840_000509 [Geoglossum simile]|nr:MAG: hypothetical protein M1840_000509 [Geoglossum simile]